MLAVRPRTWSAREDADGEPNPGPTAGEARFKADNRPFAIRRYSPAGAARGAAEDVPDPPVRGGRRGELHARPDPRHDAPLIGQEATRRRPTCMELTDADKITSTHRGHGHCIAKGAEVARMFAEFFGKENGYCHGRGGSMHIADVDPRQPRRQRHRRRRPADRRRRGARRQAAGPRRRDRLLLRRRRQQRGRLPRGAEHGVDLEAAGRSSSARTTSTACRPRPSARRRCKRISERAAAYAMPGVTVDGNDFSAVAEAVERGDRPRARRRRAEPDREPDLPLARPFQVRPQPLPHQGRDRELDRAATRSSASAPSWSPTAS